MKKPKRQKTKLEDYAAKPVLILSGSLLVFSVALNNIGFKEVVDAYAKSIVASIEQEECKSPQINQSMINQVNQNTLSIEVLAENSHAPAG